MDSITITLSPELLAQIELFRQMAQSREKSGKAKTASASIDATVAYAIDFTCGEAIRRYEKADAQASEKKISDAKNLLNAAKAEMMDQLVAAAGDTAKIAEILAKFSN